MRMSLNLDPAFLLSSRAYGLKGEKRHFGSKELSRAYGLKGKNAIWVKRIVAGVWSEREKRHFGSKEWFIRIAGYKMRMY